MTNEEIIQFLQMMLEQKHKLSSEDYEKLKERLYKHVGYK